MGVEVTAPDGRVWRVRRRLDWPRWQGPGASRDLLDGAQYLPADPGGVLGGIVLGRPWIVEERSGSEVRAWRVRGFRRSRAAVRELAAELESGVEAEPEHVEP